MPSVSAPLLNALIKFGINERMVPAGFLTPAFVQDPFFDPVWLAAEEVHRCLPNVTVEEHRDPDEHEEHAHDEPELKERKNRQVRERRILRARVTLDMRDAALELAERIRATLGVRVSVHVERALAEAAELETEPVIGAFVQSRGALYAVCVGRATVPDADRCRELETLLARELAQDLAPHVSDATLA